MCNFYGHKVSKIEFIKLKQIEKDLGTVAALKHLRTIQNGFEYEDGIIIKKKDATNIDICVAKWEFTPPWIKNSDDLLKARKQGIPWLNARSETILESTMFGEAVRERRCLVLASYFFEWRGYKPEGVSKEIKYPYVIGLNDSEYMYMAGIWQEWTDRGTGEVRDTFAIVTTEANELMAFIHNSKRRMPTILPEDLAYEWIMDDISEGRIQELASYQLPSEYLYAHSVFKDFKTKSDPTEEYEYQELPDIDVAL